MTDTVVVLGWDALDYELLERFDLADAFGAQTTRLETFENDHVGEPLTREVWPSIITGVGPETHGIYGATDDDGIQWDDPVVNTASRLAGGIVPQRVRSAIGKRLRNRGARVRQERAATLDATAHGTVFDGRDAIALSIPSYQTALDRRLGLAVDRTIIWDDVLRSVDTDDGTVYEPEVGVGELEQRLLGKARKRYGYVEAAADRGHDIVFCWFGYLDTVGHLAPAVGGREWQREHYERAAQWTRDLRDRSDATVVCVSDHGLRDGTHTHDATFAAPDGVSHPASVLDVRAILESLAPASGSRPDEGYNRAAVDAVGDQLEALGYVEEVAE